MIITHYGEIFTKGQNRCFFQKKLADNIKKASLAKPKLVSQRFVLDAGDEYLAPVSRVFGVTSCSLAEECSPELEEIKEKSLEVAKKMRQPLKVKASRSDKRFPLNSTELARAVAEFLDNNGVELSVKQPESFLEIEVLKDKAFVCYNRLEGVGGLPVGCAGKIVTLLSGGIDSPVASWLLAKRGAKNVFVHFHPFKPGHEKTGKIERIVKYLYPSTLSKKVYLVPFDVFTIASLPLPSRYVLPLFRRFMLRVAEKIAEKEGAKAIGTGESLSQVASQTLDNIAAIQPASSIPVLRPLLAYDKREIIALAEKIGTYELSLEKYNDCCHALLSKNPATACSKDFLEKLEKELPEDLVERTLKETKIMVVD
ncbi:tRNA 4-thiouridine(8) synthase ThiI [Candidatus Micrarchaeota archaeon]|nr:tRNA 4-thiouridine(8) synthase ThiI [Candidatus Micrarchaeota archaeon]